MVDAGRHNPAIDISSFSDTVASYYWSSTTLGHKTDYAWLVDFSYGYVYSYAKTDYYYVRAVRAGQ